MMQLIMPKNSMIGVIRQMALIQTLQKVTEMKSQVLRLAKQPEI